MSIITATGASKFAYDGFRCFRNNGEEVMFNHIALNQTRCASMRELMPQLKMFKDGGYYSWGCNRKTYHWKDFTCHAVVFQRPGEMPCCRLSFGLHTMVDGLTYIFRNKADADWVHTYLVQPYEKRNNEMASLFNKKLTPHQMEHGREHWIVWETPQKPQVMNAEDWAKFSNKSAEPAEPAEPEKTEEPLRIIVRGKSKKVKRKSKKNKKKKR